VLSVMRLLFMFFVSFAAISFPVEMLTNMGQVIGLCKPYYYWSTHV
jgi:hypothetical protein